MNNKLLKHITTNDSLCINYLIPKLSMLQSHRTILPENVMEIDSKHAAIINDLDYAGGSNPAANHTESHRLYSQSRA